MVVHVVLVEVAEVEVAALRRPWVGCSVKVGGRASGREGGRAGGPAAVATNVDLYLAEE